MFVITVVIAVVILLSIVYLIKQHKSPNRFIIIADGYVTFSDKWTIVYYYPNKKTNNIVVCYDLMFTVPKPMKYRNSRIHHLRVYNKTLKRYGITIKEINNAINIYGKITKSSND